MAAAITAVSVFPSPVNISTTQPSIEGQRGQYLFVERALTQGATRRLASQSEELVPDVVACLVAARALAKAAAALEDRFV